MNQEYFEQISGMVKKGQETFQAIAELNVKTLQGYAHIKSDEFSKITKPEELLEKQIDLFICNGHNALDYMQKSFQIIEKAMLPFTEETKTNGKMKK